MVVQIRFAWKGFITDFAHERDVVVFLLHFVLSFQVELDDSLMAVSLAAVHAVVQYKLDKVVGF